MTHDELYQKLQTIDRECNKLHGVAGLISEDISMSREISLNEVQASGLSALIHDITTEIQESLDEINHYLQETNEQEVRG